MSVTPPIDLCILIGHLIWKLSKRCQKDVKKLSKTFQCGNGKVCSTVKFDRPSINEREIPDYHAHLVFYSYTVVFFATKFVFFHGIKAGKFSSVFN